jgi:hypothetical protein
MMTSEDLLAQHSAQQHHSQLPVPALNSVQFFFETVQLMVQLTA